MTVVGLSERWHKEGLGPTRAALAGSGHSTLLVRKGLRPGGLAPPENLTRFTWSPQVRLISPPGAAEFRVPARRRRLARQRIRHPLK